MKAAVIDLNEHGRQWDAERKPWKRAKASSVHDAVETFRDAMAAAGLGRPEVIADGRLQRFDLPDEPTTKRKKSGWYVYYPDANPAGAFGSWVHDISESWCSRSNWELSTEELSVVRERQRQAAEAREAARLKLAREAARIAAELLAQAEPADAAHAYLAKKQVGAFNVYAKGAKGALLVPMYNEQGLISVQRIFPDGGKRFLHGTAKAGAAGWIPGDESTIYIVEGYATGASIHMATGAAVAIAFDAGNLLAACEMIRRGNPDARIIVAADNDRWTTKQDGTPFNTGVEMARRAAQAVGAEVRIPEFRSLEDRPTDFNDLHVREGLDAVRGQVKGYGVRLQDWSLDRLAGKPVPPREWLVSETIPLGAAMLLAAPGGTGKGILTLDMAIKVARGPRDGIDLGNSDHVMGHPVLGHGPVVLLAAEDDMDEVHRRAEALCGCDFPPHLYAICMPDLDGPKGIVTQGKGGGFEVTAFWRELEEQILHVRPKLVIVDPLSCFVFADLNDRNVGAHVMGMFTALARKSGAAIVVVHHLNKLKDNVKDLDAARNAISGSAGFVDHGRGAYVLWPEEESKARELCKQLDVKFERHKVIRGGLAKANFPGDTKEQVYVRQNNGLLVPIDESVEGIRREHERRNLDALERAISDAAKFGHPYQHTGKYGLYEMRERLPMPLKEMGKSALNRLGRMLLDAHRVGKYRPATGSKAEVWLDHVEGPFAQGLGELRVDWDDDE